MVPELPERPHTVCQASRRRNIGAAPDQHRNLPGLMHGTNALQHRHHQHCVLCADRSRWFRRPSDRVRRRHSAGYLGTERKTPRYSIGTGRHFGHAGYHFTHMYMQMYMKNGMKVNAAKTELMVIGDRTALRLQTAAARPAQVHSSEKLSNLCPPPARNLSVIFDSRLSFRVTCGQCRQRVFWCSDRPYACITHNSDCGAANYCRCTSDVACTIL